MTVKELRAVLESLPDDMPVAYPLYSEYAELKPGRFTTEELFDNGGYLTTPYRDVDKPKVRAHLVIGTHDAVTA